MKTTRSLFVVAVLSLLGSVAPALVAAQEKISATAPAPVPGDESTYRIVDGFSGLETGRYSRLYARREGKILIYWIKNLETDQGRVARYSANLGRCRRAKEAIEEVCSDIYEFPLSIGKETRIEREPVNDGYNSYSCKVVDAENLTLPAGRYETLKVECSGIWRASSSEGAWSNSVNFTDTHWYAPLVNAEVKYATVVRGATASHSGTIIKNEVHEMTSFKPGPISE